MPIIGQVGISAELAPPRGGPVTGIASIKSGAKVFEPDANNQVTLGNSAQYDVQSFSTDLTPGKILQAGAFGLGGDETQPMGLNTQFLAYRSAAPEVPGPGGGVQVTSQAGHRLQFYMDEETGVFYSRVSDGLEVIDIETPWDAHYTTSNPPPGGEDRPIVTIEVKDSSAGGVNAFNAVVDGYRSETVYAIFDSDSPDLSVNLGALWSQHIESFHPRYSLRIILYSSSGGGAVVLKNTQQLFTLDGVYAVPPRISIADRQTCVFDISTMDNTYPYQTPPVMTWVLKPTNHY